MNKHKVPQYLSRMPQFLWWEADEVIVFIGVALGCNIFLRAALIPMFIASLVIAYLYKKSKSTASRGYIFHLTYILGITRFKGFESVKVRKYQE